MTLLLALLTALSAHATPTFPGVVESWAAAPCAFSCSLCHDGSPGNGTATQPLVLALLDRGLQAGDETSLNTALDQLDADAVDSDGDSVPDTEELMAGTDPNVAGADLCSQLTPQYGCLNSAPVWPGALGLPLALLLVLKRRRGATTTG